MKRHALNPLECRALLSASLNAGLLTVEGDANANEIVVEAFDLTGAQIRVVIDGVEQLFTSADASTIVVNAGDGNDTVAMGSFEQFIAINGQGGNDVLQAGFFGATADGGAGNDLLIGGQSRDTLVGGDGEDTLQGNGGNDVLRGGNGRDRLDGGSGSDVLDGGNNRDTLQGRGGFDQLFGQGGPDSMVGGTGNDRLEGGRDSDTLVGGAGDDSLNGEANASSDMAGDIFSGGAGRDLAYYPFFASAITITTADGLANDGRVGENDNIGTDFEWFSLSNFDDLIDLTGDSGRHQVNGAGGNDTIIGGPGADELYGYEGNDSITGGGGEDRLIGGAGNDILVANDGVADIVRGGDGTDTATVDSMLDTLLNIENVM